MVLVSFGEKIGFAPTLDEALDLVFGGDSGAEAGDAEVIDPDGTLRYRRRRDGRWHC